MIRPKGSKAIGEMAGWLAGEKQKQATIPK